jgi:glucose-6-phosphate 1-dehydrogenase
MRDMVQNHLMQLLCLIAMEPPYSFNPDAVRDEKLKVIRALNPVAPTDIVRGQYGASSGQAGYTTDSEKPDSKTESFVAMKVGISNWRWKGTPFYLRTGKRLRARTSEIAITFRPPPHSIFGSETVVSENVLSIRLQPNEGINLMVMIKEPGPGGMRLTEVPLDMSFAEALGEEGANIPDAYERLIMDVIRGNQTLFMRGDEVEAAWAWTDPIIEGWEGRADRPNSYEVGSSGPEDAMMLLHRDGRRWRTIKE